MRLLPIAPISIHSPMIRKCAIRKADVMLGALELAANAPRQLCRDFVERRGARLRQKQRLPSFWSGRGAGNRERTGMNHPQNGCRERGFEGRLFI